MNYYITFVKGISDGTEGREILKATDLISAKAIAWSRMGSASNDSNCTFGFATIVNQLGQNLIQPISFERPTEETSEEATE